MYACSIFLQIHLLLVNDIGMLWQTFDNQNQKGIFGIDSSCHVVNVVCLLSESFLTLYSIVVWSFRSHFSVVVFSHKIHQKSLILSWTVLVCLCKIHSIYSIHYKCVGGITVSIVAFQAADAGSTPGHRNMLFLNK